MNTKTCSKCKIEKSLSAFHKDKRGKYGRSPWCAKCRKQYDKDRNRSEYDKQHYRDNIEHKRQYAKDNKERFAPYHIQYQRDHCEQRALYSKQYEIDNALRIKQRRNSGALFETYFKQLETFEKVRRCPENLELLEVKCAYCGKWTIPTNIQVKNRLQAFNGNTSKGTENRFYCSEACKQSCPTYRQHNHWKGQKQERLGTSREVDAWFRQYVLELDDWTCQICGRSKDEYSELVLHVHHTRGVAQQPMLQNDIAYAFTVCFGCHKEIHKKKGCTYFDLRRSKCKKLPVYI